MKPEPRAEAVLCRYHYDALDRLAAATPLAEATVQRVYQKYRLSVEIQGALHRRVMQFDDHVLAEQRAAETVLPATDLQRSVLHSVDAQGQQGIAYSPYGHRPSASDVFSLLGFAGERPDPVTGHYPLGKGYRAYNPVLMRFNQPDSLSPFGEGGVNAYAYCQGDPVNRSDPTGHMFRVNLRPTGNRPPPPPTPSPPIPSWVVKSPLKPMAERGIGSVSVAERVKFYSSQDAQDIWNDAAGHLRKEFKDLEAARIVFTERLEKAPARLAKVERKIQNFIRGPQPAPNERSKWLSELTWKLQGRRYFENEILELPSRIKLVEEELKNFVDGVYKKKVKLDPDSSVSMHVF
ncbi:RHS repeat-associated core domain-containing protein [Pseudomonas sp. S2_H01]